jgi:hypothetical protein
MNRRDVNIIYSILSLYYLKYVQYLKNVLI